MLSALIGMVFLLCGCEKEEVLPSQPAIMGTWVHTGSLDTLFIDSETSFRYSGDLGHNTLVSQQKFIFSYKDIQGVECVVYSPEGIQFKYDIEYIQLLKSSDVELTIQLPNIVRPAHATPLIHLKLGKYVKLNTTPK